MPEGNCVPLCQRSQTSSEMRHICAYWRSSSAFSKAARSEEHTSELQSRLHLVCRLLLEKKHPIKDIPDEYNYPKKTGIKDECSRLLEASTMKSRRGFAIQRLMNALRQAHADGWFIVFDTLTLADVFFY